MKNEKTGFIPGSGQVIFIFNCENVEDKSVQAKYLSNKGKTKREGGQLSLLERN